MEVFNDNEALPPTFQATGMGPPLRFSFAKIFLDACDRFGRQRLQVKRSPCFSTLGENTQNHAHSKMGTRRGQAPEKDSPCVTSCSFTSRLTLGNYTARMLLIKKKESSVSLGICLVCIVNAQ